MASLGAAAKSPETPTVVTPDNAPVVAPDVAPDSAPAKPAGSEPADVTAARSRIDSGSRDPKDAALVRGFDDDQKAKTRLDEAYKALGRGENLTEEQRALIDIDLRTRAAGEQKLTPEQRKTEIYNLREKIKSGEFKKEDEDKLAKLEDDEIEAVANEYDPDDPESLIATAEKLQEIAESRSGIDANKQMKEIFAKVFKEWVLERSNPNANLSAAERSALKKVQELVGSMHKDLLTIINANKQIAVAEQAAIKALEDTKAQEKKVGRFSDVSKDDEAKQQEAIKLEGMYLNLLNKRAQLLGAANAARYANNSFRMKRFQVRRSLGLVGFWGGLIESTAIRVRNTGGNAVSNIDTFLSGKPLAVKYANKL